MRYFDKSKARREGVIPLSALRHLKPINRQIVPIVQHDDLADHSKLAIAELDAVCSKLSEKAGLDSYAMLDIVRARARAFVTPLSSAASLKNGPVAFDEQRASAEAQALVDCKEEIAASFESPVSFPSMIERVARASGATFASVRQSRNMLQADAAGNCIRFPDVNIPQRLSSIVAALHELGGPPCYAAMTAQVALLNLHPLTDGNGRASRVIFSFLMGRGYPGIRFHIPTYALRGEAPFAFEVALRSSELHGDWVLISEFFKRLLSTGSEV